MGYCTCVSARPLGWVQLGVHACERLQRACCSSFPTASAHSWSGLAATGLKMLCSISYCLTNVVLACKESASWCSHATWCSPPISWQPLKMRRAFSLLLGWSVSAVQGQGYGALEGVYAWCSVQSVLGACYCYPTHWVVVLLQCCLLLLKLAAVFLLGTVLVGSPTCRHQISISVACERVCTQTVVGMVCKQAAAGLACTHAQVVQQDGRECLGLDIWGVWDMIEMSGMSEISCSCCALSWDIGSTLSRVVLLWAITGMLWTWLCMAMALGAKAGALPMALLWAYTISSVIILQWAGVSFAFFLHAFCPFLVCALLFQICVCLAVSLRSQRLRQTCSWGAGQAACT